MIIQVAIILYYIMTKLTSNKEFEYKVYQTYYKLIYNSNNAKVNHSKVINVFDTNVSSLNLSPLTTLIPSLYDLSTLYLYNSHTLVHTLTLGSFLQESDILLLLQLKSLTNYFTKLPWYFLHRRQFVRCHGLSILHFIYHTYNFNFINFIH